MPEPYYADDTVTVHSGDCLDVLAELADASVDAVVTDPPYSLSFMGRDWDTHDTPLGFQSWCQLWATECLRILKPGGHLLSFGGTRTWHRLACAVEDAGFEIRDSIAWLYGSGFPKSLDVSKAIDRAAGVEREVTGSRRGNDITGGRYGSTAGDGSVELTLRDKAATREGEQWQGWGTALKPAFEPIVVARKPLAGTVAANVLTHGTGALNIDGCRIGFVSEADERESKDKNRHADFGTEPGGNTVYGDYTMVDRKNYDPPGRWPANVVLDEHQAAALDQQSGETTSKRSAGRNGQDSAQATWGLNRTDDQPRGHDDTGGASRFFYTAKADSAERIAVGGVAHPTVKPLVLMRWLVRLITPPGGLVLDPFAGSGTTVEACILERLRCVAIEREPTYLPLITQRINRRRDPVAYFAASGDDGGLFALSADGEAADA